MAHTEVDTALVTAAELREYLGFEAQDVTDATRTQNSAIAASVSISRACYRVFLQATYTEYFDGGQESIDLPHWPVTDPMDSADGVWVDAAREFPASSKLTQDELGGSMAGEYVVYPGERGRGRLKRLGGCFPAGSLNVKVIWEGGYAAASIPEDVKLAVKRTGAIIYQTAQTGQHRVTSESVLAGGGSRTLSVGEMPADVREIVDYYRRGPTVY